MKLERFLILLMKYRRGLASSREKRWIERWYDRIGEDIFSGAKLDDRKRAELQERYWSGVQARLTPAGTPERRMVPWVYVGTAASLLIGVMLLFHFLRDHPESKGPTYVESPAVAHWTTIANSGSVGKLYVLPDSSQVTLAGGSEIRLASEFNEATREVYLDGEAFFQVAHDREHPFLVHAHGLTTRVEGTSFRVKGLRGEEEVSVAVVTGRVSVSPTSTIASSSSQVILTPNQQAIYRRETSELFTMLVEEPQVVLPKGQLQHMRFRNAPVSEVFEAIEEMYGIEIIYDASLASCALTTTLTSGGLYNRLELICQAINASFEIDGLQIQIQGGGCGTN